MGSWFSTITKPLSMETVTFIIAGGVLTFLILFIFAKRQIMRFAIRSHRGPHAPIGMDANKSLRREIMRRIDAIQKIVYEPKMLRDEDGNSTTPQLCHYHRMRAVDDAKTLEQNIQQRNLGKRAMFESLRSHLIALLALQIDQRIVHQYCDLYEAARYDPKPFNEERYQTFKSLQKQLEIAISTCPPKLSSRSPIKSLGTPIRSKDSKPILEEVDRSDDDDECELSIQTTNRGRLDKFSVPYIRRLAKVDKSRWTQSSSKKTEEERSLHEVPQHISIPSSSKDETTAV